MENATGRKASGQGRSGRWIDRMGETKGLGDGLESDRQVRAERGR